MVAAGDGGRVERNSLKRYCKMAFVLRFKREEACFKGEVGERHFKQFRRQLSNARVVGIGWHILDR